MTTKDHEVQSTTFRRLLALGLVTILPAAVILASAFHEGVGGGRREALVVWSGSGDGWVAGRGVVLVLLR
jgi:hypothetical protein